MTKYWIAVASHEHVMGGVSGGFMQVCHGKKTPLNRLKENDWIIYYSPVTVFGTKTPCQKFTAIGTIKPGNSYQYAMSADFIPWRRDVTFVASKEAPIAPLIKNLA